MNVTNEHDDDACSKVGTGHTGHDRESGDDAVEPSEHGGLQVDALLPAMTNDELLLCEK